MGHEVTYYKQRDYYEVICVPSGDVYYFTRKNGLYVFTAVPYDTYSNTVLAVNTAKPSSVVPGNVASIEAQYSKREVDAAKEARLLEVKMGYPGIDQLKRFIRTGQALNNRVTCDDLDRALIIYGKPSAHLYGKMASRKLSRVQIEQLRVKKELQTISYDVMFVFGRAFAVGLSMPMGLVMVYFLPDGRSGPSILNSLSKMVTLLNRNRYSVTDIFADGEKGLTSLIDVLSFSYISVHQAGKGQHVHLVERKIRQIKERARALYHALPYYMKYHYILLIISMVVLMYYY